MIDDLTAAFSILPAEPGVWYPDGDHAIPYLMKYRAKQGRPLDHGELTRWLRSPEVRP